MKTKYLFPIIILFFCLSANAQFSLSYKYGLTDHTQWESLVNDQANTSFLSTNQEIGLSYWFRLKNKRIEFYPEIAYVTTADQSFRNETFSVQRTAFKLNLNTQLYLRDLDGDCNCPTFSKQGNFIDKGWFLGFSPGVSSEKLELSLANETIDASALALHFGIYTGLDFGINDFFTITPIIRYAYSPNITWDQLGESINDADVVYDNNDNLTQLQLELRLTFRPDYLREKKSWR